MPRRRLGVVLVVPPPVDAEIEGLRRACGSPSIGRIPPHLTLVPPVNVREDELASALDLLRTAAADTSPFAVDLGPAATFHPTSPVVYLAVGDERASGVLEQLRRAVFTPPLERPLTHEFHPHVTLAEEVAADRIEAMTTALADYRATAVFDRVHLLQERRRDDGVRVWDSVADVPFGAPPVVGRGGIELELQTSRSLAPDVRAFEEATRSGAAGGGGADEVNHLVVVARRRGEVVGLARGRVEGERAALTWVVVSATERRLGIGSRLVDRFEDEVADRGAAVFEATVPAGDPVAALLGGRGWVEAARLDRPGRPRVVLQRIRPGHDG